MKKFLIATTALVATAGVAAAEVAVSGNGRMGVVYNGDDFNFSSRIRIVFTATGETDGGLQFGGSIRADNASNGAAGSAGNVFVSGAFGKLAMGDVVGAAEAVLFDLPEVGYQDVSNNDVIYITGDSNDFSEVTRRGNPVALYTYSTGDLTFALSMSDGNNPAIASFSGSTGALTILPADETQEYAIAVGYAFGDYSVGLGYEVVDFDVGPSAKHLILGGTATFGTTTVQAYYGDGSGALAGFEQYGIGVSSTFDALTVHGFVKHEDFGPGADTTYYGLGAAYSLGGGATLQGGIADSDAPGDDVVGDFGIKFSF